MEQRAARNDDAMQPTWRQRLSLKARPLPPKPETKPSVIPDTDVACFASHGSHGIVDLGATKTVIGDQLVKEFLEKDLTVTSKNKSIGVPARSHSGLVIMECCKVVMHWSFQSMGCT